MLVKRIFLTSFLVFIIAGCNTKEQEDKHYFYSAISDHWEAEMVVTQPSEPEPNLEVKIEYIYTGTENNSKQRVSYKHIEEWLGDKPSMETHSDYLPTDKKPYQDTLYSIKLLSGYKIGQKWRTLVTWEDDSKITTEELIFIEKK